MDQEYIKKDTNVDEDWLIYDDDIINWYLKDQGFDGVIDNKYIATGANEFVAFEPNQIKSTDNRGTFSPDTGNIYYQRTQSNGYYDAELKVIVLGRNMNTMTLPHEMAHFWLDNTFSMFKKASKGELTIGQQWIDETNTLFSILGIDPQQETLTSSQQETFATMTEAVITGLAPIPDGATPAKSNCASTTICTGYQFQTCYLTNNSQQI